MTYKFQFIADTRFDETKSDVLKWDKELKKLDIRIIRESGIEQVNFMRKEISPIDRGKQWRKTYVVDRKEGQTWNDVFGMVNSVHVARFERVK